jgi:hypothetical protein
MYVTPVRQDRYGTRKGASDEKLYAANQEIAGVDRGVSVFSIETKIMVIKCHVAPDAENNKCK